MNIENHMGLAVYFARSLWKAGKFRRVGNFQDLLQECFVALVNAGKIYEPKGVKFSTFATYLMLNRALNAERDCGTIRLPRNQSYKNKKNKYTSYAEKAFLCRYLRKEAADKLPERNNYPQGEIEDVLRAVAKLPLEEREFILGLYGVDREEVDSREWATLWGLHIATVRQRRDRVLRKLRTMLEGISDA